MVGELVMERFRVLERIGSGGMGTVYRAFDERLQRDVAVKEITGGDAGRVLREAQAAARLNHPGIVTLYELGVDDGRALLVSELVDGATLDELARLGELSDRDVADLGAGLCEALAHAHARGVVHRDIKPQNVIVRADAEGRGRAKLMDFGIAALAGSSRLTASGEVVGTLAYMAPEQAAGEDVGPAADAYSLALTLYECWAGTHPVRRESPAATARAIGEHVTPLRSYRPDLPYELTEAIDACLDSDPALRPTLAELAASLVADRRALEPGRSVPAPAEPATAVAANRSGWALALVVGLAAGAGLAALASAGQAGSATPLALIVGVLAALLAVEHRVALAGFAAAAGVAALTLEPAALGVGALLSLAALTLAPVLRLGHIALALLAALLWAAGIEGLLRLAGEAGAAGPPPLVAALAVAAVVLEFRARERSAAEPGRPRPASRRLRTPATAGP